MDGRRLATEDAGVRKDWVERADLLPLAAALIQATDDRDLLQRLLAAKAAGPVKAGLPPALQREVRAKAYECLCAETDARASAQPGMQMMQDLVRLVTDVPASEVEQYAPMMLDQAGFTKERPYGKQPGARNGPAMRVAVIGAGMSGICAAIELKRADLECDVFDRNASVGGTWHENQYPGCGVDTPSMFYAYSFEPRFPWNHHFAKRDQIAAYFEHCVDKYGVRQNIHLQTDVRAAVYDEAAQRWQVTIRDAEGNSRVQAYDGVISAVGQLNIPSIPRIPGLDTFHGKVLHTAQWDPQLDLAGKRVGLIGTGASAMQVGPAIVDQVEHLTVFQREPHWVLPNSVYHRSFGEADHWLFERLPYYAHWLRAQLIWSYGDAVYPSLKIDPSWQGDGGSINAISESYRRNMVRHLKHELAGRPDLIEKALPDYPPYAKRVLLDNNWYKTLRRDHVDLVVSPISEVRADGIVSADGQHHPLDVIVLATGFQASRMLSTIDITGRQGIRLRDAWDGDNPRAYLGITVPRFPNLFLLYGPNTNLGYGGSAIFNAECQTRYAVQCLVSMREQGWGAIECRQDVHDAYNETVDAMHQGMVWSRQDVDNWYRNSQGRVTTNSPWRLLDYWTLTHKPNHADYNVEPRRDNAASAAPSN
ncbi:hypothetical protein CAL18_14765 [Bordetella genomosp. 7]|uniref:flavin-containing monooxygenase n=1 Tax=Bordetella genomosp. 7 TaxID=1416805 RepID=UPI000B9E9DFA|nr:NAD(P)/FAD-dependent oxidoreductase [Bordetella genomosp. 7]OZI17391.1 hypothetical protein CAL18_14765 [Bordetella genomosp. 7]